MKKIEAVIFDLDGTLYSFDDKNQSDFSTSRFGQTIYNNCITFFEVQFNINPTEAKKLHEDLKIRYKGEISLGVERELGIDRSIFFNSTWNFSPKKFMTKNQELKNTINSLTIKSGILTAAPRVWADKVLEFLTIKHLFDPAIFTGDADIRKPSSKAFKQLSDFWKLDPKKIISIGDQELTDILPAKSLGMTTVRIGRNIDTQADFLASDVIQAIKILKKKEMI